MKTSLTYTVKIIALVVVLGFQNTYGQTSTIKLWPGIVPGETESKHAPEKIMDNKSPEIIRISQITDPDLLVFEPTISVKDHPAIMICPGGGYSLLAIDIEGTEIAKMFNDMGFTAFVLQYRVPKKRDGALQDAQRAMVIIRSQAQKYHIDANKIGVIGFSAGGSLCARLSTAPKLKYPAIDENDSLSYRPAFSMLLYPAYLDEGVDNSLSSDLIIDSHTPPMFILQTQDDLHANSALVMTSALRKAKVPVELHLLFAGGKHGFGIRKDREAGEIWPGLASEWFKRIMNIKPSVL